MLRRSCNGKVRAKMKFFFRPRSFSRDPTGERERDALPCRVAAKRNLLGVLAQPHERRIALRRFAFLHIAVVQQNAKA